eukprot:gene56933-78015_t
MSPGVDEAAWCARFPHGCVKVTARSGQPPPRPFRSTGKVCPMQISKWMIVFVAVYGGLGGVLFDAVIPATSRQHLWNPAWPPHA